MSTEVFTLAGAKWFPETLTCLSSFVRHCKPTPKVLLLDDGTLLASQHRALQESIPGLVVIGTEQRKDQIASALKVFPALERFRQRNILSHKLIDPWVLCSGATVRYLDSDLYFLRAFKGFLAEPQDPRGSTFLSDLQSAYALSPRLALTTSWPDIPRKLNTGMYRIPRSEFSLARIEELLQRYERDCYRHDRECWAEQTLFALHAGSSAARCWSSNQIMIASAALDQVTTTSACLKDTVGIHFVSSERHRLPEIACLDIAPSNQPIELNEQDLGLLNRMEYLAERVLKRVRISDSAHSKGEI